VKIANENAYFLAPLDRIKKNQWILTSGRRREIIIFVAIIRRED
jgi:hypothetical protein